MCRDLTRAHKNTESLVWLYGQHDPTGIANPAYDKDKIAVCDTVTPWSIARQGR
jgi:hypothetical protein